MDALSSILPYSQTPLRFQSVICVQPYKGDHFAVVCAAVGAGAFGPSTSEARSLRCQTRT